MREPDAKAREMGRSLLAREAGDAAAPAELAAAAERVFLKLGQRLTVLMGNEAVRALLVRSLHLAQADFLFLKAVKADGLSRVSLEGLPESVDDHGAPEVRDGLEAFIATFVWLLSVFIGWDLASRQVQKIWPALPPGQEANR